MFFLTLLEEAIFQDIQQKAHFSRREIFEPGDQLEGNIDDQRASEDKSNGGKAQENPVDALKSILIAIHSEDVNSLQGEHAMKDRNLTSRALWQL